MVSPIISSCQTWFQYYNVILISVGEAPGNFDMVIVNDQVEPAYQKLRAFLLPDITELRNLLAKSSPNTVYQNGSGDKN